MKVWARIGANIQAAREAHGLTREALGALCKLTETRITAIERGESKIDAELLVRIATALRTTPLALLRGVRWDLGSLRLDVDSSGVPGS